VVEKRVINDDIGVLVSHLARKRRVSRRTSRTLPTSPDMLRIFYKNS
jgi:hypothetical protein